MPKLSTNADQNERLIALIILLSNSKVSLTADEITQAINLYSKAVSKDSNRRTFERDKRVLKDVGIEMTITDDGRYSIDKPSNSRHIINLNSIERAIIKSAVIDADLDFKLLAHVNDIGVFDESQKKQGLKELQVIYNGN